MTRPLAWAGFSALCVLLLSIAFLPSAVFVPLAVLLLAAAAIVLGVVLYRHHRIPVVFVLLLAAGAALLCLYGHQQRFLRTEVLADGRCHTVAGAVCEVGNGLYPGVISAVLRVDELDGESCRPFRIICSNVEACEEGEQLLLNVEFETHKERYRNSRYASGIALSALQETVGAEVHLGKAKGLMPAMARLRGALADYFMVLGRSTGGTAAAMVVGDRSRMDPLVESIFRRVGISHILVVSGLHLSLLNALLTVVLKKTVRRRVPRLLLSMLGILAYMLLTGMTVSVVRAGILQLLASAALLADRTADTLNSLGLALVILLTANPYAAMDFGLLLSFAATLGVLCFTTLNNRHFHLSSLRYIGKPMQLLGVTFFATLFTLPVLAWQGTTVSLGVLAANLLCTALVTPIMVIGFAFLLSHLVLQTPHMLLTGRILYLLLRIMESIAKLIDRVFVHRLGVTGWIAVVILLCAGATAWITYHSRLRRWCALAGVGVLMLLSGANIALNAGVVRVALVGGGINPAVVISRNTQCAVLHRGDFSNITGVKEYLELHNLAQPEFVADLSQNHYGTLLQSDLGRLDLTVGEDVLYTRRETCLTDVELLFVHQKSGNLCYIEVDGVSIGVCAGPVDCSGYPVCSFFLAGISRPEGLRAQAVIRDDHLPDWIAENEWTVCYTGEEPVLWLRPGKSFRVLGAEKE